MDLLLLDRSPVFVVSQPSYHPRKPTSPCEKVLQLDAAGARRERATELSQELLLQGRDAIQRLPDRDRRGTGVEVGKPYQLPPGKSVEGAVDQDPDVVFRGESHRRPAVPRSFL